MLTLPIKGKWFDMILTGEKKEEYRENTVYWRKRLLNEGFRQGIESIFNGRGLRLILSNGYGKDAPKAMIELSGFDYGNGRPEWGAEPNVVYIRLHIKRVIPNTTSL